jgi:hypothetical protein
MWLIALKSLAGTSRLGEHKKNYGANAPQLHPIFRILKNSAQTRHSCTLF